MVEQKSDNSEKDEKRTLHSEVEKIVESVRLKFEEWGREVDCRPIGPEENRGNSFRRDILKLVTSK